MSSLKCYGYFYVIASVFLPPLVVIIARRHIAADLCLITLKTYVSHGWCQEEKEDFA